MTVDPNPWHYIASIIGHRSLWGRSRDEMIHAIERAERDGQTDAAGHLRIMLRRRDEVCFDVPLGPVERPEIKLRNLPRDPIPDPIQSVQASQQTQFLSSNRPR